jgi:CheY-like chemotaxis protein
LNSQPQNPLKILLVEDNEGDIFLTNEAFKSVHPQIIIDVVRDGEQAINYLKKQAQFSDVLSPDLILLDINLPKVDGLEVLLFIKNEKDLMKIPVIILTTSASDKDVLAAYHSHANCYITKPVTFSKFTEVVRTIKDFWTQIVHLP